MNRHTTRVVKIGNIKIGGGSPIAIQAMIKSAYQSRVAVKKELRALEACGADIVRVAVKNKDAISFLRMIKHSTRLPLVADIHFDAGLAREALKAGVDKLRINPSNITDKKALREVIVAAARKKVPIRIGVNSGSVRTRAADKDYAYVLFQEAKRAVDFFAEQNFRDLVVSIKSSRVRETIAANRYFSEHYDYPLHLGVTATGPKETAIVKSAIGIGVLLEEGIGDTIRVSLTDDSASEVRVAQHILQALELQFYQPDIISCPVCSRCGADLRAMLEQLRTGLASAGLLSKRYAHLKIALMGCEVNGPGEARMADIGLAIGGKYSMVFKRGVAYRKVPTRGAIPQFITEIKKLAGI